LAISPIAKSSELEYRFSSPAFNGNGYSSHVLTIEQLQTNRKKDVEDDIQAEEDKALRDLKATNSYKFRNNLESRIYATLSKNIADQLFGEDDLSTVDGEWYSAETPFGDNVSWKREDNRIYITVSDSNGDLVSEFDVPIGDFAF
tara:strand:- start:148 stop:582 length:435 start_codon:yes stop_codon:yes gene_type:complete